jgi:hypothetical protein
MNRAIGAGRLRSARSGPGGIARVAGTMIKAAGFYQMGEIIGK